MVVENVIHSCVYNIYILAYNSDSTYVAMSDQISIEADLPKKPDFNYITSVSVNPTRFNSFVENPSVFNSLGVYAASFNSSKV